MLRASRRKTVNMQLIGLRLVVSITQLTRSTADLVRDPPTLLPVSVTTVLRNTATTLTITIVARVNMALLQTVPS